MAHETVDQFLARKRRERSGSIELDRVTNSSELFQIDQQRTQQGSSTRTGDSIRDLYGRFQLDASQRVNEDSGGGLFSSFGTFARKLTEPLIDVPDLPGPLNIIEEGIEELSSPIGLASAALIPFTGGTSLGLRGAAGIAAQAASRASAEIVVGGLAVGASSFVNDNLPDNTPAPLRLIANIGAGAAVGGATSQAFRRSFAGHEVDNIVQSIQGSDAARKIGRIVNETPDLIRQNADDLTTFRGQQMGAFEQALGSQPFDEKSFKFAKRSLAGTAERTGDAEMAVRMRNQFTPKEIDDLYGDLAQAYSGGKVSTGELLSAESGLTKLLNGTVPQQNEWDKLSLVFGSGLKRAVDNSTKSAGRKALDITLDLANTPRALAASADMSAPLRQGIMLIGHPREFASSTYEMVRSFFDEDFANHIQEQLTSGVRGRRLRQMGVEITDYRAGAITAHEEQFISQLIHNVPGLGQLTRASERAYTVFLNKLRADVFDHTVNSWKAAGKQVAQQDLDDLAKWVNWSTGRGTGKFLSGDAGRVMSAGFFSPRFLASRFQAPTLLLTASPKVRRQVAQDLGIFLASGVGVLTLMKASGVADVEIDPRSSDFGKGKVGNTRFDFWGGYQQIARYMTQAITNEKKTTSTGEIVGLNRAETVGRFFQSKLSPPVGLGVDTLRGETIIGEELDPNIDTLSEQALARTLPFFLNDVKDAYVHSGMLVGSATIPLSFFGAGSTSFSSTSELIEQYGLDTAEPNERIAILAQNPELAEELVRRTEVSAERGSEAAQRRITAEALRDEFTAKQSAADSMLLTGQLTAGQWRDQRKILSVGERNAIQTLYRDVEPGPETPLSRYFQAIEEATNPAGQVDWDVVDLWKSRQPQSDIAFIERNTGLRNTDLENAYTDTLSSLDEVGFFDITDEVWGTLAPRAGVTEFASYQDWRQTTLNQLTQVFVQQGMDQGLARQEAERRIATHPIHKAYASGTKALRNRFTVEHPELTKQAVQWGLFSTTIEQRQFLSSQ